VKHPVIGFDQLNLPIFADALASVQRELLWRSGWLMDSRKPRPD